MGFSAKGKFHRSHPGSNPSGGIFLSVIKGIEQSKNNG